MLYPKDNICRQQTESVIDFVNHIADITPIRFYCYAIVYHSGGYINFSNHDEFHDLRFNRFGHISSYILDAGIYKMSDFNDETIVSLSEDLGIYHAIGRFKHYPEFTEVSVFALDKHTQNYASFFYNHATFLETFTEKFKIDFKDEISLACQSPLNFPSKMFLKKKSSYYNLSSCYLSKHFNHFPSKIYKLSNRETECLKLLLVGKKRQEIAKEIGVSLSSVGTYIKRLLDKLELNSKSELMSYAWRTELIKSIVHL